MKKVRVGVLFGGRSGEHEVSLLSAASVLNAIDKKKYEVVPIGITKEGRWVTAAHAERLLKATSPARPSRVSCARAIRETTSAAAVLAKGEGVVVPPMPGHNHSALVPFETNAPQMHAAPNSIDVDIIFPVLHGTFGEDGTIQGLLELADIAYVGAGVLGSAAGMDKDVMKRLFRDAGLPIVKHVTVLRSAWREQPKKARKQIESALKYPVFVKPANLGSSVGISKVHESAELAAAMDEAARFDRKLVIEQGVGGKQRQGARDRVLRAGQRQSNRLGSRRDRTHQGVLRLRRQVLVEGSEPIIPPNCQEPSKRRYRSWRLRRFKRSIAPAWRASTSSWIRAPARCTSTKSIRCPASLPSACIPRCGRRRELIIPS